VEPAKGKSNHMSARESELKPEEKAPETLPERVERELTSLRENGILKKELPTITMSTFRQLSPQSQMDFCKAGGKLTDDPPPPKVIAPKGAVTRSAFESMTREAKLDFARSGAKLYDDEDAPEITSLTRAAFRDLSLREQASFIDTGGTITDGN
jgi:hypothetical protein